MTRYQSRYASYDEMVTEFRMNTTTATYQISVTTDEGSLSFLKDMPTRPKTQKGIKSQNNKLSKWVEKQYPNYTEYEIIWSSVKRAVRTLSINNPCASPRSVHNPLD